MVDSINQGPSLPVSSSNASQAAGPAVAASSVAGGFSTTNSVSYAQGSSSSNPIGSLSLTPPTANSVSGSDFLQKAFDARLEGFRAIVSDFNDRFNAADIDLSDTQTLLMVVKGMVSDTRALVSAETINQVASSRSILQGRRQSGARDQQRLQVEIQNRQRQIDQKSQYQNDGALELAQKNVSRLSKEHQLADARVHGGPGDVAQLEGELSQLQTDITALEQQAVTLGQALQQLESQNAISKVNLAISQQLIALITVDFVSVRALMGRIKERFDPAALDTGEDELDESKIEEHEVRVGINRESQRLRNIKQDLKSRHQEVIAVDSQTEQNVSTENAAFPINGVISPVQLQTLARLFPVDPQEAAGRDGGVDESPPSIEQLQNTSDALALVIQAEPPQVVNSVEEDPVSQSVLGDSYTLEGANNPQAFSRLLLMERINEVQSSSDDNEFLANKEAQEISQISEMLSEVAEIEEKVAIALVEAEQADAVIKRSPV